MSVRQHAVCAALLIVLLLVMPMFVQSRYVLGQFVLFFIWVGVTTQWNLVLGVAGIFSLAQMLVFAIGGYSAAMLMIHLDWSIWVAILAGGVISVIASTLIGISILRLRGAYVALLTLAIASAVHSIIVIDTNCYSFEGGICLTLTGGASGLSRFPDFGFRELLGFQYAIMGNYYLGLGLAVLGAVFVFFIMNSPMGHAFQALRDNETCAASRGINRTKYQIIVFSLSAFFTGLIGGFYAGNFRAIGPTVFDLTTLLFLMSAMVVGGIGRFWGPILGCALLMTFDHFAKDFAEWRMVGIGAFTVIFVVFFPTGIVGVIEKVNQKIARFSGAKRISHASLKPATKPGT